MTMTDDPSQTELFAPEAGAPYGLCVTLDYVANCILLEWSVSATGVPAAAMRIRCTGLNELTWELDGGAAPPLNSTHHRSAIRSRLNHLRRMFPVDSRRVSLGLLPCDRSEAEPKPGRWEPIFLAEGQTVWTWLEESIVGMARHLRFQFSPLGRLIHEMDPVEIVEAERFFRREGRLAAREDREAAQRRRKLQELHQRQAEAKQRRNAARLARAAENALAALAPAPPVPRPPLPPVPVTVDLPALQFQDTLLPLTDVRRYLLAERAALWWVSNQSDDLLGLPYCDIQRLDYQIRTALRVLGPLRGRALLSDEVGLGKTIEAGLVMKEYLTRGMIKRFLVLTVPSLVDQWEEELLDKFHLPCVTTNQAGFRADPAGFWQGNPAVIASLHTLKQPAHLAVAQTVHWDLLVIDEAHYLRNRASQAWQAVNALPRQYLLLLTATPVQNSLEDLYNLVTLLQPGQLPSPKEFRDRFIDKKHPHQPREPEELRRVLGHVMIRNTRANAGIDLPPRRAETVLFEPDEAELAFWQRWDSELRAHLATLNASQASLWGRLLLQAAGSSPAAWRHALRSFPIKQAAREWGEEALLESSWAKKCELVVPLTRGEGGVVIFTQFLETQAALADRLKAAGALVWVINGQTPAERRQPITEEFRRHAGALLLTHSGTEGRNLQFCHRLVNFDLPWNPMEIEQRIGRLHRLGQQQPVRIHNLVQKDTLQEHLLQILQEKLNLFELVVGETGLILGERFSSDEFAEEVWRRWRESEGRLAEAMGSLGDELAAARNEYRQVKELDETLFAKDYETL
jgi:superfamily II DNA or RNA helicase